MARLVKTWCRATLNYASRSPGQLGGRPVEVDIRDGRASDLPDWRATGFDLVRHHASVNDWTDDDEIAEVHYPEVEELVRNLSGCDVALVSDHVKRNAEQARREREQSPVRLVHSDFAADYEGVIRKSYYGVRGRGAKTLARAGITAEDVDHARRIVMFQLWRNVGPAKMDLPVAFCDGRTLTPADARPFHYGGYVAGGRSFNALAIVAPNRPSDHHWYAFPEMTADEAVAFRTYDTDLVREGKTYFTPHSAFRDPTVELGNPARFSVELRVACLFL